MSLLPSKRMEISEVTAVLYKRWKNASSLQERENLRVRLIEECTPYIEIIPDVLRIYVEITQE